MSLMLRIIHYSYPLVDLAIFALQDSLFLFISTLLVALMHSMFTSLQIAKDFNKYLLPVN